MNGKLCRIKGTSKYLAEKYGTSNPEILVECTDKELWPNGGWGMQNGNPACLQYAMRSAFEGLSFSGVVYYGKVNGLGELVHESELELV